MARPTTSRRLRGLALAICAVALACVAGRWLALERLYAAIQPPALPRSLPVVGLASRSAEACGGCHADNAREWRASRHGRATTDPFFRAEREAQGGANVCLRCHAPLFEQSPRIVTGLAGIAPARWRELPNPSHDATLEAEGVTCVVCHQRNQSVVGPLALDTASIRHATEIDPSFGGDALCVRCHAAEAFPFSRLRRAALATFEENAEYRRQGGDRRCIDCHLPQVSRPLAPGRPQRDGRSHRLLGAEDGDFLRAHLDLSASCERTTCIIHIRNRAGHRFPTGEPGRDLAIRLDPASGVGLEKHILRRMDRIALVEEEGEDDTLLPGEARAVTLGPAAWPAVLSVRFCLYEERDPLLRATGTPYASACVELARWSIGADGAIAR